jgi:RND family efflux transporter MFP subunit
MSESDTDQRPSSRLHELRIERPDPRPARYGARWALLGAVVFVLAAVGWWTLRPGERIIVRTALAQATIVEAQPASSVLDATGYVTARRQATVSSEITGKVREVLIEEGMTVEQGQILARLDDTTEQAELALARARLESTRALLAETDAQLTEARQTLMRTRELNARQLASQQDLDSAEATASTLAARLETGRENVRVGERTVELQQQKIDEFVIRAPFAGVVIAKNAQPGEMISPISAGGGFTRTGICTIVDMDSLEIEVDVNEAYIQRVSAGQPVTATLDAYPDWQIPAEVIAIIPTADRQKATVRVRIDFLEKDPRVLPDMGVRVAFLEAGAGTTPEQVSGITVPSSAVATRDGETVVFVVEAGRVQRRPVSIAGVTGAQTRIAAGLAAGERVVVDPPEDLGDGVEVDVGAGQGA